MVLIGAAFFSWVVLTASRVLVFILWTKLVSSDWPRGHWVLLAPQVIWIFIFSFLFIRVVPSQDAQYWLYIGTCWLIYTLVFEFVGVLVFEKGSLSLLFEGWKLWKGNIWVLVLLSHLFAPYLVSILGNPL